MFKCKILKNTEEVLNGDVESLVLNSAIGTLEVLQDHAEIYVVLVPGDIIIQEVDKSTKKFLATGGTLHFRDNFATLLIHTGFRYE